MLLKCLSLTANIFLEGPAAVFLLKIDLAHQTFCRSRHKWLYPRKTQIRLHIAIIGEPLTFR